MDMKQNNTTSIDFENYVRSFSNRHTSSNIKNNDKTKKGGKIKPQSIHTSRKKYAKHTTKKYKSKPRLKSKSKSTAKSRLKSKSKSKPRPKHKSRRS